MVILLEVGGLEVDRQRPQAIGGMPVPAFSQRFGPFGRKPEPLGRKGMPAGRRRLEQRAIDALAIDGDQIVDQCRPLQAGQSRRIAVGIDRNRTAILPVAQGYRRCHTTIRTISPPRITRSRRQTMRIAWRTSGHVRMRLGTIVRRRQLHDPGPLPGHRPVDNGTRGNRVGAPPVLTDAGPQHGKAATQCDSPQQQRHID